MISKTEIENTHNQIAPFIHRTPILTSHILNKICGCKIFVKPENFQKVGAFKMRGAINAILNLSEKDKKFGVATHSSGNHAAALAKAATEIGIPSFIIMPKTAPQNKIDAVANYGGTITFSESTLESREQVLTRVIQNTNSTFIHPYNNRDVILGQSTAAKEIFEDVKEIIDYIIAPVGGGGLLSGTSLSAKFFSPNTKVIGAEPFGANDAFRSIRDKTIYPSINPKTIADGLLTSLSELTYSIISENVHKILLAEERTIVHALMLILTRMKIVVEPSAVLPLAVILENPEIFRNKNIAIILSGGNLDFSQISNYLKLLD